MEKRNLLVLLTVLTVIGCSSRQIYDSFQYNQRNECVKLPESQYDECMQRASKPFDRYEKERSETLNQ